MSARSSVRAAACALLAACTLVAAAAPSARPASARPLRIVSLAPNLTEDLFAIGAGGDVVGVDAYSDRPAAARRIRRVGALRGVNEELILALHPDLVLGIPFQEPELADLARAGVRTRTLTVDSLNDDFATIEALGSLAGRPARARGLVAQIRARMGAASRHAHRRPALRAFVVVGTAPIYTAARGSFIDDLLRMANLTNVARTAGGAWPPYSAERLVADDPDILVLSRSLPLPAGEPWTRLAAVRTGRILRVDDDTLLRPGPHVADALEALVAQADRWRRGTTVSSPSSVRTSISTPYARESTSARSASPGRP